MSFNDRLHEKAMQWEREGVGAIARAILNRKVRSVRYFLTTTDRIPAVEVETTDLWPKYALKDPDTYYRHAVLVENYQKAQDLNGAMPYLPRGECPSCGWVSDFYTKWDVTGGTNVCGKCDLPLKEAQGVEHLGD